MKLNGTERLVVNNPARALVQRFYELPLLRQLGGSVEACRVLEIGCGRGVGVELLLGNSSAAYVCGIDLDERQIRRARKRLSVRYGRRCSLQVARVERLPFRDESFDAVFDCGILHHAPVWQAGVAEIRRVLRAGGTLFFEEVTRAALDRWLYRIFLQHPTENRFSEVEFLAELEARGLKPTAAIRRVLCGDIFIGAARLPG